MKYIDQTQQITPSNYPPQVQEYIQKMESLDGVETEEYFDLSDGLESFLEPYKESGQISEQEIKKLVIRYSYTLDQIECVKGIRLF